jgi:hypothetical protein
MFGCAVTQLRGYAAVSAAHRATEQPHNRESIERLGF